MQPALKIAVLRLMALLMYPYWRGIAACFSQYFAAYRKYLSINPLAKLSASNFGVTKFEAPDRERYVALHSLHTSISPASC